MTASFLAFSLQASLILLTVALALAAWRVVLGPTLADRVLALDTLSLIAVGFISVFVLLTKLTVLFDIALGLCCASFLATVAFARFIRFRSRANSGTGRPRAAR